MPESIQSGFLDGPNGELHLSIWRPAAGSESSRWVLLIPPFAEEMNKCRPMLSRQAKRLAALGLTVVAPDLSGTGDSAGEFATASWDVWKTDVAHVAHWCAGQGASELVLWGVRLGCLLAMDAMSGIKMPVPALLMWQPVLNGRLHMNQFLRLRMAAGMMQGESESVASLRELLAAGESVEVAGYQLSAMLFNAVEALSIDAISVPNGTRLIVHEVAGETAKPLLPVTVKQLDKWREQGVDCSAAVVTGSQFWLTQEIGFAPTLLEAGCEALAGISASSVVEQQAVGVSAGQPVIALQGALAGVKSLAFDCEGEQLLGQLHMPAEPVAVKTAGKGVLIVVGGPQYRVGSHRQFVQLARALCEAGLPVLRFDYRGMGDATGELRGFEAIQTDIRAAVDVFQDQCEGLEQVVIWGLCDGATAAAFYAHRDPRVKGLVLLNPWVYSVEGAAKAYLKHYYLDRLFSADLWRKVLRGEFKLGESLHSVAGMLRNALGPSSSGGAQGSPPEDLQAAEVQVREIPAAEGGDLAARMAHGLQHFSGSVLLLLSGNDLTAAEFEDAAKANPALQKQLKRGGVQIQRFADADHTFSHREWSVAAEQATANFVHNL